MSAQRPVHRHHLAPQRYQLHVLREHRHCANMIANTVAKNKIAEVTVTTEGRGLGLAGGGVLSTKQDQTGIKKNVHVLVVEAE